MFKKLFQILLVGLFIFAGSAIPSERQALKEFPALPPQAVIRSFWDVLCGLGHKLHLEFYDLDGNLETTEVNRFFLPDGTVFAMTFFVEGEAVRILIMGLTGDILVFMPASH